MRFPKISGDTWLNTKPLTAKDLKNKVVLADFWTYSCANCQRTLPYLREWWRKYKNEAFILIGIHTPEFEFEKDLKNVEQAVKDLKVDWPVVLDNEYVNWNNFANHYWPAKYLADKTGKIVYTHFGEGGYEETERIIQELLQKDTGKADLPKLIKEEHAHGAVCFVPTPETYCGYDRGKLNEPQDYIYDQMADYEAPLELEKDSIALDGKFLARPQYVESGEAGATLLLKFRATEVNLVLHPVEKEAEAEILLNGEHQKNISIVKPTLYNLLKSDSLIQGTLAIRSQKGNFRAYAFTFSGCENGSARLTMK